MTSRAELVEAAREAISKGSQSFKSASKLFAPDTRERAWLLYSWCRALDDLTDGQALGHSASAPADPAANQARLMALTVATTLQGVINPGIGTTDAKAGKIKHILVCNPDPCPQCGSFRWQATGGTELRVVDMRVMD